jgi:excisionase family DNA binding protein
MHDRLQFGMREDPALARRRHGSRAEIRDLSKGHCFQDGNPAETDPTAYCKYSRLGRSTPHNAASLRAATGEGDENRLLTVQQVADILHVPVSWVYGRTRKRSTGRLPGIRLGKYWRFREEEVHKWIDSQRGGHRVP